MSIYSKFNVQNDNRAYYIKDGIWCRIGGDEFNNVTNCMTESDTMKKRIELGVAFSELKTENEMSVLISCQIPE